MLDKKEVCRIITTMGSLIKSSGWSKALPYIGVPAGAIAFSDVMSHGRGSNWEDYKQGLSNMTMGRAGNALLNGIIGTLAVSRFRSKSPFAFSEGLGSLLSIPGKDVLFGLTGPVEMLPGFMRDTSRANPAQLVGTGALAAALPLAYYGGKKLLQNQTTALQALSEQTSRNNSGTVKVALPPPRPGFPHTIVELPVDQVNISRNLTDKLERDVRRRLRAGTNARTFKRDPETHDLKAPTTMQ